MSRYRIDEVTNGEWEYIEDDWTFERAVKDLLYGYLSYPSAGSVWSETALRYFREDDWHECRQAPDKYRPTEDAPSYVMHCLLNKQGSLWEVKEGGKLHTLKDSIVTCLSAEEDDEYIYLDTHVKGQCPHFEYWKDIMRKIVLKAEYVVYFEAEGCDENGILERSMERALEQAVHEDIIEDRFMDEYEYDCGQDIDSSDYTIKVHKCAIKKVRKIPR